MAKSQKVKKEIDRLKLKLRSNDPTAANNLAVIYRRLGNRKRAFFWWKRATETWDDGDSYLEIAYCYQYGLGVRLNKSKAILNYKSAIRSNFITQHGYEEARYHLAIALLDSGTNMSNCRKALTLLQKAAADGDFPEAKNLIQQLKKKTYGPLCRCRRGLLRSLGGKSQCQIHDIQRPRKILF